MQWLDKNLFCMIFDRSFPSDSVRLGKTCRQAFGAYRLWIGRQVIPEPFARVFVDLEPRAIVHAAHSALRSSGILILGFFRTEREASFERIVNDVFVWFFLFLTNLCCRSARFWRQVSRFVVLEWLWKRSGQHLRS